MEDKEDKGKYQQQCSFRQAVGRVEQDVRIEQAIGIQPAGGIAQHIGSQGPGLMFEPRGVPGTDAMVVADGRSGADQRLRRLSFEQCPSFDRGFGIG